MLASIDELDEDAIDGDDPQAAGGDDGVHEADDDVAAADEDKDDQPDAILREAGNVLGDFILTVNPVAVTSAAPGMRRPVPN